MLHPVLWKADLYTGKLGVILGVILEVILGVILGVSVLLGQGPLVERWRSYTVFIVCF